ncbi:MAG: hypothetical protein V3U83_04665 [Acidobacteriota bacterium]
MAYLRFKKAGKGTNTYAYIMESRRRGDKVHTKILEYLGKSPSKERLRRACEYWDVKPKGAKRRPKRKAKRKR